MKLTMIISRLILGLIFTVFSLAYFFNMMPGGEMNEKTQQFVTGLDAATYVMPLIKFIELICGISFLTGRLVPLASVVIFPIVLNIFLFHVFLETEGILISILLLAANLFLAFFHRQHYSGILSWK